MEPGSWGSQAKAVQLLRDIRLLLSFPQTLKMRLLSLWMWRMHICYNGRTKWSKNYQVLGDLWRLFSRFSHCGNFLRPQAQHDPVSWVLELPSTHHKRAATAFFPPFSCSPFDFELPVHFHDDPRGSGCIQKHLGSTSSRPLETTDHFGLFTYKIRFNSSFRDVLCLTFRQWQ